MKIKGEQLARALRDSSPALIWLSGDEPLLMQEAGDLVRGHYQKRDFLEREIFNVDKGFSWTEFTQASGNLSLFGSRKTIELRLSSNKLEDAGKKALQQYLQSPDENLLILISSSRLEGATLNTKWFKSIESAGLFVQIWPINREGLPNWLQQRLLREGISADAEALELLTERIEGNLLAAMQEIEKLKLIANSHAGGKVELDRDTVLQVVADNSRFTVFQAVDAALQGDAARAHRVLTSLRNEGLFPLLILGAVTRELRNLLPLLERKSQGQGVNAILQSARVWYSRKAVIGAALQRLNTDQIWALLEHARLIDQSIKGMNSANCWDELSLLLTRLAGVPAPAFNRAGS